MRENFEIKGCFYRLEDLKCRKYLDIRRKGFTPQSPDLLVVMMNPGNSRPLDGIYSGYKESEASPDRTQMQIMRVMENCGFSYCRILNLTDIQEPKSNALFQILSKRNTKRMAHSIFDPKRQKDFEEHYPKDTRRIFAWGVDGALTELARQALDRMGYANAFGLQKKNIQGAYYHPLPPSFYKQQEWVRQITEQLKNSLIVH